MQVYKLGNWRWSFNALVWKYVSTSTTQFNQSSRMVLAGNRFHPWVSEVFFTMWANSGFFQGSIVIKFHFANSKLSEKCLSTEKVIAKYQCQNPGCKDSLSPPSDAHDFTYFTRLHSWKLKNKGLRVNWWKTKVIFRKRANCSFKHKLWSQRWPRTKAVKQNKPYLLDD